MDFESWFYVPNFSYMQVFLVSISTRLKTSSINFCNSKGVASEKSSIRQLVFNSLKFHTICAIRLLLINYYIKTGHVFIQVALSKHKKTWEAVGEMRKFSTEMTIFSPQYYLNCKYLVRHFWNCSVIAHSSQVTSTCREHNRKLASLKMSKGNALIERKLGLVSNQI